MCPPESASIRKDILVATRHILATDFRVGFFSQIDVLLDEKLLIGQGTSTSARSSHETLRPLACSTLADLVHHVRGELGIKHLSRVVYIFSCNIHDASLPLAIQTTSVRLLLNLVENIFHKNDAEGRALLVRILHCLVCKFATLKVHIARQLEESKAKADGQDVDGTAAAAKKLLKPKPLLTAGGGAQKEIAAATSALEKAASPSKASPAAAAAPAAAVKEEKADEEMPDVTESPAPASADGKEGADKPTRLDPSPGSGKVAAAPPADAGTSGLTARAMAVLEKARGPDKDKDDKGKVGERTASGASKDDKKGGSSSSGGETKEVKQMLKTMILGVKTVVWSVSNSRMTVQQPHPMQGAISSMQTLQKGMSEAECLLVARLLNSGLECFAIYNQGPEASAQEEKDVLDYFAGVFTVLDVRNFTHVFQMQMAFLYARVLQNNTMSTMLQHFLANSTVSRSFADILLTFLVERIEALGSPEEPQAAVLLRLFKLVFGSITLFPENEPLLRPHLSTIVTQAMRHAAHAAQPSNYFSLLRALFKSIGGGKFEQLYKEFLPLLPTLLQGLIGAHAASHQPQVKELLLELCLTLPARLSSLLPYLHMLMRPVLHALRASQELVSLALRTLEFWIDHLHPGFLAPLLSPVMRSLLLALTKQLLPHPYPFGPTAVRILGKLGGRNRQYLHMREPLPVTPSATPVFAAAIPSAITAPAAEAASTAIVPGGGGGAGSTAPLKLPLDAPLSRVLELLQAAARPGRVGSTTTSTSKDSKDSSKADEKKDSSKDGKETTAAAAAATAAEAAKKDKEETPLKEGFKLVRTCVCRLISDASSASSGGADGMDVDEGAAYTLEMASAMVGSADAKGVERFEAEEKVVVTLFHCVALAAATPATTEEASSLLNGISRHVSLLLLAEQSSTTKPLQKVPPPSNQRAMARPRVFIDAMCAALGSSQQADLPDKVIGAVKLMMETVELGLTATGGSSDRGTGLIGTLADSLFTSLCHLSYTCEAPCRKSVLKCLREIVQRQPVTWQLSHEIRLCAAMMHACEDEAKPDDAAAASLLADTMKACHGPDAKKSKDSDAIAKQLVERMVSCLSASTGGTRDAAKSGLATLAKLLDTTVGELLMPLRDSHLKPLLARRLRALALPAQVAITEAVCFVLKESPRGEGVTETLPLEPPLIALLGEALLSAEGEDAGREKPRLLGPHARGVSLDIRLRVVSIELLCAAMPSELLKTTPHADLRNRMISCFFKSLTVRSDEVRVRPFQSPPLPHLTPNLHLSSSTGCRRRA